MNSLDSMIESTQNVSTFIDEEHNCTAIDKTTGQPCGEPESLKIIDEFQKLYENRIQNVDQEIDNEFDRVFMKLEISREWIKDLREQNVMLVQVVEDLEQTTCNRMKLLEQKLKQSSMIVSENLTKPGHTEKAINLLSNRVSNLQKDEEYMRQRIEFLQSDIRGLLELIRRASQENHWNLDGIKFIEIQPNDIPAPIDYSCGKEETNQKRIQSLKLQIEQFQENERKMITYQRELEDKLADLTAKLEIKEDTIKKYLIQNQNVTENLKTLTQFGNQTTCNSFSMNDKQTSDEAHTTQNAYIDTVACQENHVISYLTKVKSLMEQDNDNIFKLKVELEKTIGKLYCGNNEDINIQYELSQNIDYINKISPKKKELVAIINSIILRLENNNSLYVDNENLPMCVDFNQQFKLMDIIRACAIEAQVTTEDIKDGMALIACTFKSRHEKYIDLNEEVVNVQKQLIRNREKITEALSRLQLQEEERIKHSERITSGNLKLKDIKNEINLAQGRLSMHLTEMQSNMQESILPSYSEMSLCNDLVCSVIEEVEQTSKSLQVFHTQECCTTSDMEEIVTQLCAIESCIMKLQQKINEALSGHETVETTLCQKEDKLKKLEEELDVVHSKIQHVSKIFFNSKDQTCDNNGTESQLYTQTWNEILQTKQDLHKLRKEHDDLKLKMSQETFQTQCKDKCLWKCKVTDLQKQVKILQHEVQCKQEANEFLRSNIKSMEEELRSMQTRAENYRRSHSMDSIELKKKIIQLENALKSHEERECILQQQLNESEVELNKSKELLNSFPNEVGIEEILLRYECHQLRHDTMSVSQLFKTLENTMRSTKCDIQDFKTEFKKLIYEDQFDFCSSARSLMNLVDKLQKCEDEIDNCSEEIEKLKNALYSKNKLIEDRDKMIRIQKEAIKMTQSEIKELHQKLQEKIDNQDQILSKFEKEKKQLLRQNELQNQTIGHLQNAVVEAKRCIDQMGHRTMSDLQEKCETIRLLTICVEETQSQYNECFLEVCKMSFQHLINFAITNTNKNLYAYIKAVKQEKLLELRRDAINQLQQKICYMEYDNYLTITSIHITHYSMLKSIQEQLEASMNDIQALKHKIDTLVQSKCYSENKYLHMRKLWRKAEEKLQETRKSALKCKQETKMNEDKECQSKIEVMDRGCTTQDIFDFNDKICNNAVQLKNYLYEHQLQSEIDTLTRENEDMKKQLEKCKLDFDIIDKELKIERENETYAQQISFELQKMRDTECCLRYENEQLKSDLEKRTKEIESLMEELRFIKENDIKFEKLLKKLEDKQIQINNFYKQIKNNESIIKGQTETIEELEKNLVSSNMQIKGYLAELNDAEEEMTNLHDRIKSLKNMLIEKSNDMTKLQADYEVLKLKEIQMQLRCTEVNYHRATEDYHKAQGQLLKMTKREADLQKYITNMEKEYCSKISSIENEKANLTDCLDKVNEELENIQGNYISKNGDHCKLQDICKSYAEQLEILQQQVETEREKVKKIEESNCCMMLQLKECTEQNCLLIKEKTMVEQTNCEIISELQDTHKSLLELRKECQLKNKSLACISAELTETAISRSELCNQSQYIVSCIRIWMMEQRDYVNKLSAKLKHQQQQLRELEFAKKSLLEETRKLKRSNHLLTQRLKRGYRCSGKNVGNVCAGCHVLPSIAVQNSVTSISTNSKHLSAQKKSNLTKATRRISTCGNTWWFPKMKYLTNELRKRNLEYQDNFCSRRNIDSVLEESRDCGYQSSASK
nr:putative leucine-rich repeat-containing protein DDB_G0290503 isoform X4 [Nomia melanderi]